MCSLNHSIKPVGPFPGGINRARPKIAERIIEMSSFSCCGLWAGEFSSIEQIFPKADFINFRKQMCFLKGKKNTTLSMQSSTTNKQVVCKIIYLLTLRRGVNMYGVIVS